MIGQAFHTALLFLLASTFLNSCKGGRLSAKNKESSNEPASNIQQEEETPKSESGSSNETASSTQEQEKTENSEEIIKKNIITNYRIELNSGVAATNKNKITVSVTAENALEMMITLNPECADGKFQKFAGESELDAPTVNGLLTVYAKFRNSHQESECVNDSVIVDRSPPSPPTYISDRVTSRENQSPAILWNVATDTETGISAYQLAFGTSPGATNVKDWVTVDGQTLQYESAAIVSMPGQSIYTTIRSIDIAGNVSPAINSNGWIATRFCPNPTFTERVIASGSHGDPAAPDGVWHVTAGDLDSDGDIDVVAALHDYHQIVWYENDGNQSFSLHSVDGDANWSINGGPQQVRYVSIRDVNKDGKMDIVGASSGNSTVSWYENNGSEVFTKHVISSSASGTWFGDAYDIDLDGDQDFLVASGSTKLHWFENAGNQTYTEHILDSGTANWWAADAKDIDGDGDMDIVAFGYDDGAYVFWNNGSSSFSMELLQEDRAGHGWIAISDADSDDSYEVLIGGSTSIKKWKKGNLSDFIPIADLPAGNFFWHADMSDLDGDGNQDLTVAYRSAGKIIWFKNNGSSYTSVDLLTGQTNANAVKVIDVNKDGYMDVVYGINGLHKVGWLEQTCPD